LIGEAASGVQAVLEELAHAGILTFGIDA